MEQPRGVTAPLFDPCGDHLFVDRIVHSLERQAA
jgi:hypothetical protein